MNNSLEGFESHCKTVKEILAYNYTIPIYQREYAWEQEQLEDFWNDLIEFKNRNKVFFMGAIVLTKNKSNLYEIIDGQQRMTTISLFLAALRDICYKNDLNDLARKIQSEGISKTDFRNNQEYKLELGSRNKFFFKEYIQLPLGHINRKTNADYEKLSENDIYNSNKLIYEAYKFFYENLKMDKMQKQEKESYYINLIETLFDNVEMINIITGSDTDAFLIFETLNNRGKDLTIFDILKSQVYKNLHGGTNDIVMKKWEQITENLDIMEDKKDDFLRHHWCALHEFSRKNELYERVKNHIEVNSGELFVEELLKSSTIYCQFLNPDYEYWQDDELEKLLKLIKSFKFKSLLPFLLFSRFKVENNETFKEIVKICFKFSFKFQTICKGHPFIIEKLFNDLILKCKNYEEELDIISILRKQCNEEIPDSYFREAFLNITTSSKQIQRYILSNINNYYSTGETVINTDTKKVHVEHILPQKNRNGKYKNYNEDEYKKLVNRLGNLTLLSGKKNQSLSNKPFKEKKRVYETSEINLTKKICYYDNWDETTIEKRQKDLAKIAIQIWKI